MHPHYSQERLAALALALASAAAASAAGYRETSTWDDRSRQLLLTSAPDASRPEYAVMIMSPPSRNMHNLRAQASIPPGDPSSAMCSQKRMEAIAAARPRTTTNSTMKCARSCTQQMRKNNVMTRHRFSSGLQKHQEAKSTITGVEGK